MFKKIINIFGWGLIVLFIACEREQEIPIGAKAEVAVNSRIYEIYTGPQIQAVKPFFKDKGPSVTFRNLGVFDSDLIVIYEKKNWSLYKLDDKF